MDIPAIYSVFKYGQVKSAPVKYDGAAMTFVYEPTVRTNISEDSHERTQVVVTDVKGITKKKIDDRLLMTLKIPGNDIWFMSHIEDVEDVFDSFMGEIEKLLMPYHTVRGRYVMEEAFDVSDNCIPVLFVIQGRVLGRGGEMKDIREATEDMERIGFDEIIISETDSYLRADDWISLHDRVRGLIPFVRYKNEELASAGFKKIIVDL